MTASPRSPSTKRVLVFTGAFLPGFKAGGPIKSMVEVLDRLPIHVRCTVVTADRDLGDDQPYEGLSGRLVPRDQHEIYYLDVRNLRQWRALARWVRRTHIDLLYLNSLWSPVFSLLPLLATRLRVLRVGAVLLAPRGELSPGALGLKARKKRAFLVIWRHILRSLKPWFQASTPMESAEIRAEFPWAHVLVQANTGGEPPREQVIPSGRCPRFVFISRISEKKNLDLALRALKHVRHSLDLDIYGPVSEPRYWKKCETLISELPEHVHVTYRGELPADEVSAVFAHYDAFLFPTLGENFGHVIVESFAAGCPVVASENTPWTGLLAQGAGQVIQPLDAQSWATAIEAMASLSADERTEAKVRVLHAYGSWRLTVHGSLAVETALAGHLAKEDGTRLTGSPPEARVTQVGREIS